MSGTGCPLTHEFNNSGGESPEWVRTNTGKGRVGGLSQAVGPGLRTELAGPHSHDCHWMWVVYIHLILLLCSALYHNLRRMQELKPKSGAESSGWMGIERWNARLIWALCTPMHLPSRMSRWRARWGPGEGQRPILPLTRGQGSGHNHMLSSETYSWITAGFILLDILHMWLMAPSSNLEEVIQRTMCWTSLVVQWLRICLPMQGTWVWALIWEDPIRRGATEPVCRNYWSSHLEPVLRNKRSHHNEKPTHCNEE